MVENVGCADSLHASKAHYPRKLAPAPKTVPRAGTRTPQATNGTLRHHEAREATKTSRPSLCLLAPFRGHGLETPGIDALTPIATAKPITAHRPPVSHAETQRARSTDNGEGSATKRHEAPRKQGSIFVPSCAFLWPWIGGSGHRCAYAHRYGQTDHRPPTTVHCPPSTAIRIGVHLCASVVNLSVSARIEALTGFATAKPRGAMPFTRAQKSPGAGRGFGNGLSVVLGPARLSC